MKLHSIKSTWRVTFATSLLTFGIIASAAQTKIPHATSTILDYNRDIKPIFSNNCFICHGPDEKGRMAKLRLDKKEEAIKQLSDGQFTILPGESARSVLVKRISSKDPNYMMPPPFAKFRPSEKEIETIRRWIDQGAQWKPHWSFLKPERPPVPVVKNKKWPRNEIDYFILVKLEQEGLKPSHESNKLPLLRRVTFDLTGLPPTPAEIEAFLKDKSSKAYEKVVDRLLASKHYGERMAQEWLDLARYADTHGYHIDSHREMWPWRDWVIGAFNNNKPFDDFTVEQLAGDLLPHATVSQKIASGFNRNGMINFEGGADPNEYAVKYVVDRVNTTSTVWLGLTMGCAQCHDHKYDPFTNKEYYQFYAFFNNVPEKGLDGQKGNAQPILKLPASEQQEQLNQYKAQEAALRKKLLDLRLQLANDQAKWEASLLAAPARTPAIQGLVGHYHFEEGSTPADKTRILDSSGHQHHGIYEGKPEWVPGILGKALKLYGKGNINLGNTLDIERTDAFSYGAWVRIEKDADKDADDETVKNSRRNGGVLLAKSDNTNDNQGFAFSVDGGKVSASLTYSVPANDTLNLSTKEKLPTGSWHHVMVTYDGSSKATGVKIYFDGKVQMVDVDVDNLSRSIRTNVPLRIGRREAGNSFRGLIEDVRLFNRALSDTEVAEVSGDNSVLPIVRVPADQRSSEQAAQLSRYYVEKHSPQGKQLHAELREVLRFQEELDKTITTTMVMQEMPKPRETHMLARGDYRQKGEAVTPNVPQSLPPLPPDMPANRLALAQWLVNPNHPLTSRVVVNRFWQQFFGTGIVKTAEDFGSRGEWPSHPELLDWLATEFIASKWNVKAMMKRIVMSATYRQSAHANALLLKRDPENRLIARGPRLRLNAEMIRDNALAISGLLNLQVGGKSVFPYQPKGLWEEMAYGGKYSMQNYKPSTGKDLYRRGMYTFWKRSAPHPSQLAFDAPDREICTVRRQSTNTPLQALVLLNDPTYVEAARAMAQRIVHEGGKTPKARITFAFQLATTRRPKPSELKVLLTTFNQQLKNFQTDPKTARELISLGESKPPADLDVCELAAWTAVAHVILNLSETITKG